MRDNRCKITREFHYFLWCIFIVSFISLFPEFNKGIVKYCNSCLMIVSECLLIHIAVLSNKKRPTIIPKIPHIILVLVLIYNTFLILKGLLFDSMYVPLSFWGNIEFQPAYMLPLLIYLGREFDFFFSFFKGLMYYSLLVIPLFLISGTFYTFLGMMVFILIAFIDYLPKKWRIIVIILMVFYIIQALVIDARTPLLRIGMAMLIWIFSKYNHYISQWLKYGITFLFISLPIYFFILFYTTGYSVFADTLSKSSSLAEEHATDTRTFLYEEVLWDLTFNDAMVWGKGINSRYYSQFFSHNDADSDLRVNPEVGFLSYMLKGGVIMVILNLLLILFAVYHAFIKSKTRYLNIMGAIILGHFFLLFIENIPKYDLYNITTWFMIGLCLSKTEKTCTEEHFKNKFKLIF